MTTTQQTPRTVPTYLAALVWDGTPRIDRWLTDYVGAPDTDVDALRVYLALKINPNKKS